MIYSTNIDFQSNKAMSVLRETIKNEELKIKNVQPRKISYEYLVMAVLSFILYLLSLWSATIND